MADTASDYTFVTSGQLRLYFRSSPIASTSDDSIEIPCVSCSTKDLSAVHRISLTKGDYSYFPITSSVPGRPAVLLTSTNPEDPPTYPAIFIKVDFRSGLVKHLGRVAASAGRDLERGDLECSVSHLEMLLHSSSLDVDRGIIRLDSLVRKVGDETVKGPTVRELRERAERD